MNSRRLQIEAPEVADVLAQSSRAKLRGFLQQVCARAVTYTGIDDPLVRQGLDVLQGATNNAKLSNALKTLAGQLDEQYFAAQEISDPSWSVLFRQARTAEALSIAVIATNAAEAGEAIDEAAHAPDNLFEIYGDVVGK